MNTNQISSQMDYLKLIKTLDRDVEDIPDYINSFAKGEIWNEMIDSIDNDY